MENSTRYFVFEDDGESVPSIARATARAVKTAQQFPERRLFKNEFDELNEIAAAKLQHMGYEELLEILRRFFYIIAEIFERWVLQQETFFKSTNIYTGSGGVAQMLIRKGDVQREMKKATDSSESYLESMQYLQFPENVSKRYLSFLQGIPGILALKSYSLEMLGEREKAVECIAEILQYSTKANSLHANENELLFGRAGYMYAILFTQQIWCKLRSQGTTEEEIYNSCLDTLRQFADQIIADGINGCKFSNWSRLGIELHSILCFEWHEKCYLGAAHGIAGILNVLLLTHNCLFREMALEGFDMTSRKAGESKNKLNHLFNCIVETLGIILEEFSFSDGNIQSSTSNKANRLVHWCHGAPGFVPLLILLDQSSKQSICVRKHGWKCTKDVIECMGNLIWSRGLLKKGLGLCHGLGGNGLILLSIYRHLGDKFWLRRGIRFALFGIEMFNFFGEKPDRPWSLYEGQAGFVFFLREIIFILSNPYKSMSSSAYFPGYEISMPFCLA